MGVTLPPPIAITSPGSLRTPPPVNFGLIPAPAPTPQTYTDERGIRNWIYREGATFTLWCAPSSVCLVHFPASATNPRIANPGTSGWRVELFPGDGPPVLSISPSAGASDTGVAVNTDRGSYSFMLHADASAFDWSYGFLQVINGRVKLPSAAPVVLESPSPSPPPSDSDDITEPEGMAPLAPLACPASYSLSEQGTPPFWPHRISVDPLTNTVAAWFPANGIVPVVGVPTLSTPYDELWLDHLAMVQSSGEIDGSYRVIRVMGCYSTIVFYTGFGHSASGVILHAAGLPTLRDTHPAPTPAPTPTPEKP